MWRFYLLPSEVHQEVFEAYEDGDWMKLMRMYNKYRVSVDILTVCCARDLVIDWTEKAIEEGWIMLEDTTK